MTDQNVRTLAKAEQYAAQRGVRLTATDRMNIQKAQQAELHRLLALNRSQTPGGLSRIIDNFNRIYPLFLESLVGLGNVLLTLVQTFIISFGIPLILVLLLIVEQQRVVHGIMLFEADPPLAAFAAWALVLLNLVLEVQIHYIEHQAGYRAANSSRFSFRLWLEEAAYIFGISRDWQPKPASPAQRYKQVLRLVTFGILALALAGSMRSVIAEAEGAWYSALINILTASSLTLMLTWLGGLLFAAAAVLSAQRLSQYVAIRTVEILSKMTVRQDEQQSEYADALDAVAVQYVLAKLAASQTKKGEGELAVSPFLVNGPK